MSKTAPKTSQAEPTAEPDRDGAGRMLDRHGLPLSGPARAAALDGKPDPALADQAAPEAPKE